MSYITTPTGGPSFSKQSETDPGSLWPVGPSETALQDVEVVNEINERAQNQAREVAQVVQDPKEARRTDAVEQLLEAAVAGKRRRESEISKRLQTMRTGKPEEREKLVREEIEKARDAQRKMLYSELNRLTHSILETNLQSLIEQFTKGKLTRNENEREETLRREALILSVSQIVTVWPSVGGNNDPKLCGYDALLIAAGPDNFKNFYNKTSSVRDALSVLLNGESLCDTIDTSLLCLEHEKLRDTNALTSYDVFDYLSQSVLGEWDVDNPGERFLNVVHARRTTLKDVPRPPWGVWGDERTRVVCGKYVRVLEGLVRQVEDLNWNKMANEEYNSVTQEIEFSTWTTPKVKSKVRTGARLVENWDGALAFEVVSFLWRAFHHSSVESWDTNLKEVEKLPDIGGAPIGDATWGSSFPSLRNPNFNKDENEMQMGRSYLMRLLYTCYSHPKTKWFLRCPASVVLYTLLEQSAITEGFMTASMLKPKINEDDEATLAFKAARKYCFDTANGKTFKTSESMAIMINKHITNKPTTKLKRPKYPNRAHTKFLKGAFKAVNLGVLWKHPKLTKAFIGVIVISAGVWYFCGTTALAAKIGGSTLSYAIENPLTNFVFNTLVKNPAEKALHQGTVEAVNAFFGRPGVAVFETGLGIWSYTHNGLVVLTERMAQAVGAPDNIADAIASAGSGIVYLVASSAEPVSSTLSGPLGRIVRSAVSATPTNMTAGETIQEDETVQEYDVVGMEGEALLVLEAIRIGSNTDYDPCIPNDSPVTEVGHALSEMHSLSVAGWLVQNQTLASDEEEEEDLSKEMTDEAGKYLADVFERDDAVELAHALSNSTTRSGKVYKKAVLTRVAIPLSFPTGIDDESTMETSEKRSKGTKSSLSQRLDIVAPLSALLIKK